MQLDETNQFPPIRMKVLTWSQPIGNALPLLGARVELMFEKSEPTCCFSHSSRLTANKATIVIVTVAAFRLGNANRHSVVKETKTEGQKIVLIYFFKIEMQRYGKNVKVNFCKI